MTARISLLTVSVLTAATSAIRSVMTIWRRRQGVSVCPRTNPDDVHAIRT